MMMMMMISGNVSSSYTCDSNLYGLDEKLINYLRGWAGGGGVVERCFLSAF